MVGVVEMKGVGAIFSGGWSSGLGVEGFLMIALAPGHYSPNHFFISDFIFFSLSQYGQHL